MIMKIKFYSIITTLTIMITFFGCKKDNIDIDGNILSEKSVEIENLDWESNIINIYQDSIFTFDENILDNYDFEVGDILISKEGSGYLRRISSIDNSNGEIIVTTDFASLTDAFEKATGEIENFRLTPNIESDSLWFDEGVELLQNKDLSIGVSINNVLYDFDGNLQTKHDQVKIVGSYTMSTNVNMEVDIEGFKLDYLKIQYEFEKSSNITASVGIGESFVYKKKIASIPCGTFLVGPLLIEPVIELEAGFNIGIGGAVSLETSNSESSTTLLTYENNNWNQIKSINDNYEALHPEFSVEADAKVYIKPILKFKIYKVLSPYISAELYLKGSAEVSTDDLLEWEIKMGLKTKAGVKMQIFDNTLFDYSATIFEIDKTILEGTYVPSVTDYDGNTYQTVKIGDQIWMAENLKSLHYSDGNTITGIAPYVVRTYEDNENYATIYGRLYSWGAAINGLDGSNTNPSGIQGVCPCDWHIPSYEEWIELINYLGGEDIAGGKMKSTGIDYWLSPNTDATNESKFTAVPGGFRMPIIQGYGGFVSLNEVCGIWTSTPADGTFKAYAWMLNYCASLNSVVRLINNFNISITKYFYIK